MRALLGGKGANLGEMTRLAVPVPSGFTITTEACIAYLRSEDFQRACGNRCLSGCTTLSRSLVRASAIRAIFFSYRSGAKFSMPGMMDTLLNIGLNDETVEGMAQLTQDERFAFDLYRRLIQMFGHVSIFLIKQ